MNIAAEFLGVLVIAGLLILGLREVCKLLDALSEKKKVQQQPEEGKRPESESPNEN